MLHNNCRPTDDTACFVQLGLSDFDCRNQIIMSPVRSFHLPKPHRRTAAAWLMRLRWLRDGATTAGLRCFILQLLECSKLNIFYEENWKVLETSKWTVCHVRATSRLLSMWNLLVAKLYVFVLNIVLCVLTVSGAWRLPWVVGFPRDTTAYLRWTLPKPLDGCRNACASHYWWLPCAAGGYRGGWCCRRHLGVADACAKRPLDGRSITEYGWSVVASCIGFSGCHLKKMPI